MHAFNTQQTAKVILNITGLILIANIVQRRTKYGFLLLFVKTQFLKMLFLGKEGLTFII